MFVWMSAIKLTCILFVYYIRPVENMKNISILIYYFIHKLLRTKLKFQKASSYELIFFVSSQ